MPHDLPISMPCPWWSCFWRNCELCVWFFIGRRISFCSSWWNARLSQMQSQHPHAGTNKPDHLIVRSPTNITSIDSQQAVPCMQPSPVCWTIGHNTTENARRLTRYCESKALLSSCEFGYFVRRWSLQMWSHRRWKRPRASLFLPSRSMHCEESCAKKTFGVTSLRHNTHCSTKLWSFSFTTINKLVVTQQNQDEIDCSLCGIEDVHHAPVNPCGEDGSVICCLMGERRRKEKKNSSFW